MQPKHKTLKLFLQFVGEKTSKEHRHSGTHVGEKNRLWGIHKTIRKREKTEVPRIIQKRWGKTHVSVY
jgi:hypothetical protein